MNSPVWPPVNRRRPSGVHLTTVIGFFDLPIDWCKCRTGMLSAGECTRAMGGAICWKKRRQTVSHQVISKLTVMIRTHINDITGTGPLDFHAVASLI